MTGDQVAFDVKNSKVSGLAILDDIGDHLVGVGDIAASGGIDISNTVVDLDALREGNGAEAHNHRNSQNKGKYLFHWLYPPKFHFIFPGRRLSNHRPKNLGEFPTRKGGRPS